jgi:hypothetical protein
MGYYPEGCPIEVMNVSKSMRWLTGDSFDDLANLKAINVDTANPYLVLLCHSHFIGFRLCCLGYCGLVAPPYHLMVF